MDRSFFYKRFVEKSINCGAKVLSRTFVDKVVSDKMEPVEVSWLPETFFERTYIMDTPRLLSLEIKSI